MTTQEYQTVIDLQRVKTIRAELDALDASPTIGSLIGLDHYSGLRRTIRDWERRITDSLSIRKTPSKAIPLLEGDK